MTYLKNHSPPKTPSSKHYHFYVKQQKLKSCLNAALPSSEYAVTLLNFSTRAFSPSLFSSLTEYFFEATALGI